jgi:hypothetical protein
MQETQIVVRISNEDKAKLKVLAKIHNTSISELIRKTISQLNK